ncbi:RNA-directed DNA polymerase [Micromonospora rifamycinica]|uniref:RNA-directed DNA polymerase n=1 Tax=Micromonospora rifamycinica TaxID=291594 RepID=UPI002E27E164|nr:RNA-directed DNA polymerase [Micromonospora rifamycinica]
MIEAGDYQPDTVDVVDLPKDRLMVRPLTRLQLNHRLIYDAAALAVAPVVNNAMPDAVWSSRWWERKRRVLAPTWSWMQMQRAVRRFQKQNPDWHMARTDVTSFYEHIEVDALVEDLNTLSAPKWAVEILSGFLHALNDLNNVSGLPQGPDTSGILANLYLLQIDLEIQRLNFTHFRYSDDIIIFGSDWIQLREVILRINRILRSRNLILSSTKTRIVDSKDVLTEVEDMEKDAINYGVQQKLPDTLKELKLFFDRTVSERPPSARDLKFSLTQLRRAESPHAVSWLLRNLGEIPHLAREVLVYLGRFHETDPRISYAVANSLTDQRLAIYSYAQQHILIYLIKYRIVDTFTQKAAWDILTDRNADGFLREFAARYIGRHPASGDGPRLRLQFMNEENLRVRRALLVACYESGGATNDYLSKISKSHSSLRLTAEYLKSGPKIIPTPQPKDWT